MFDYFVCHNSIHLIHSSAEISNTSSSVLSSISGKLPQSRKLTPGNKSL